MELQDLRYVLPKDPARGPDALRKPLYDHATVSAHEERIIREYHASVDYNLEEWLDTMMSYCHNVAEKIQPQWKRYAGAENLNISPSFAYYMKQDVTDAQLRGVAQHHANNAVAGPFEMEKHGRLFGMGVIANDPYETSVAFVHRMFCEEQGIEWSDQIDGFALVTDAMKDHMRRMFWCKWEFLVPRPAQVAMYLRARDTTKAAKVPTYASQYPRHPSWGMGHGVCFYGTLAECERVYGKTASNSLHTLADEGSMMRCDLMLHYPQDAACSHALVHAFLPDSETI